MVEWLTVHKLLQRIYLELNIHIYVRDIQIRTSPLIVHPPFQSSSLFIAPGAKSQHTDSCIHHRHIFPIHDRSRALTREATSIQITVLSSEVGSASALELAIAKTTATWHSHQPLDLCVSSATQKTARRTKIRNEKGKGEEEKTKRAYNCTCCATLSRLMPCCMSPHAAMHATYFLPQHRQRWFEDISRSEVSSLWKLDQLLLTQVCQLRFSSPLLSPPRFWCPLPLPLGWRWLAVHHNKPFVLPLSCMGFKGCNSTAH